MSVALLGLTHETDNYGVRVLLSSAVELLAASEECGEIILLDYGVKPAQWTEQTACGPRRIRLVNLRFSWRLYLPNNVFRLVVLAAALRWIPFPRLRRRLLERNSWLVQLRNLRFFAISGGDSFSDLYGLRRLLYIALPKVLILLLGRPLVLLPQTYGPFRSWFAQGLGSWILRRADVVLSRDPEGPRTVSRLAPSRNSVRIFPDIGFALVPGVLSDATQDQVHVMRARGTLVGLNVSSLLWIGGYTRKNMFRLREPYAQLIEQLLRHLVSAKYQLLLIPHVWGGPNSEEDETRLCRDLAERFSKHSDVGIQVPPDWLDHRQVKALIGSCDLFIGSRMHACIAAVGQSVPCVALAYSGKFRGVFQRFPAGVRVIDLRIADAQEVLSGVDSMVDQLPAMRQGLSQALPSLTADLDALRSMLARIGAAR